ncbi:MAG: hypothetical protein Q4F53_03120 [Nesterenkonia sp.]|uniref:hypothetical protein n=1 Tax=Nesterenkonia marinintestina TaxID=2979865 RepID=UPI0021C0821D|nr:hypothetical protein [Nesterenkonia sp. GX14115]MDO5492589.1 hypothetical protein [Nesterenkonia sp.]
MAQYGIGLTRYSQRDLVVGTFGGASLLSLGFAGIALVDPTPPDVTAGTAAFSLLVPFGVMCTVLGYRRGMARGGFRSAGSTAALIVVSVSVAGILISALDRLPWEAEGVGAWLAVAAVWCLSAVGAGLLWRPTSTQDRREENSALDDDDWTAAFRAELRLRNDMTRRDVDERIGDAHDSVRGTGERLAERLGPPAAYATTFTPRHQVLARRGLVLHLTLVVLASVALWTRLTESGGEFTFSVWITLLWVAAAVGLVAVTVPHALARSARESSRR